MFGLPREFDPSAPSPIYTMMSSVAVNPKGAAEARPRRERLAPVGEDDRACFGLSMQLVSENHIVEPASEQSTNDVVALLNQRSCNQPTQAINQTHTDLPPKYTARQSHSLTCLYR